MAGPIEKCRQSLDDLARRLDIAEPLKKKEDSGGVNWSGEVAAARVAMIDQEGLDRWFADFGKDLSLTWTCETASLDWSATRDDHDADSLRRKLQRCAQYGDPPMTFAVDLSKPDLKRLIPGLAAAEPIEAVLFFWAGRLCEILSQADERFLETSFLGIPEDGSGATDRRLLILVADTPGILKGPYLAVLGNDHHGGIAAALGAAPSLDSIRAARELTREMSNREDAPRVLTPDFFELTEQQGFDDCRWALARLRNRLVISSLANRTFKKVSKDKAGKEETTWTSVFTGTRVVEVPLNGLARPAGPAPEEPDGPLRLYRWVHKDEKTARTNLEIVRRVTASQLLPKSAESFDLFVVQSERILADSIVQLDILIEGNIIASFERQEKLDDSVRKYTQEVGGRIAALGKEVVDNTYRTVGLLVAVAIAYLLKPDQGLTLVAIAILLYELYVIFVRWFYIGAINKEFESEKKSFQKRWKDMAPMRKFFDRGFVVRLRTEIKEKNQEFSRRYRFVHWLYNVLIAAGIVVLLGLWIAHQRQSAEAVRARVLARQADTFAGLGYQDIRVDLPGRRMPAHLTVGGGDLTPDLTAIKDDAGRTPVMVAFVSCSKIRDRRQLEGLQLLKRAADERQAELQLLTEAECRQAGEDRAREWLAAEGLGGVKVWAW